MSKSSDLGAWGEKRAAEYLMRKGYLLLERNYRSRYGEIDLILEDGEYLVFAEVKLRKNDRYGNPAAFVTGKKQEKLRLTALTYLQSHPTDKQPRFDVIEIYAPRGKETDPLPIHQIMNAF